MTELIPHRQTPHNDLDGHEVKEPGCFGCLVSAAICGAVCGLWLAWVIQP
jgi:hypothetical protein